MLRIVLCIAFMALAAQAQKCDQEIACEFNATVGGTTYYYDFSPDCRTTGGDYHLQDSTGHDYYAQICGYAEAECLPQEWEDLYEHGVAVQMWGDTPACPPQNATDYCIDKDNPGAVKCCTSDCQVLGVGNPTFRLLDSSNPKGGVMVTHTGAPTAPDDPFWCPWDPVAGQSEPRKVNYVFLCDDTIRGAVPVTAFENSTLKCEYTLTFRTPYACANAHPPTGAKAGLSGGSVFLIVFFVLIIVYVAAGIVFTYATRQEMQHVHADFWGSFGANVRAGVYVVAHFSFDGAREASSGSGSGGGGGSAPAASPYSSIDPAGSAPSSSTAAYTASPGTSTGYTDL